MEIRHLKCMVAVAEEGQFRKAAERLHIAQPALSQNIKQLELDLNVELFVRTTRKVYLTDAGRAFYPEAIKAVAQLERAAASARNALSGEVGTLRLGFTDTTIVGPVRHVLHRYKTTYPEVQIQTVEGLVPELFRMLSDGDLDVVCCEESAPHMSYECKSFPQVEIVAVLHKGHPLARTKKPLSLAMFDNEAFILPRRHTNWLVYDRLCRALLESGVHPAHEYYADNAMASIALVAAGLGVCLVPEFIRISLPEVVYRRLSSPALTLVPQLIWKHRKLPQTIANFVALV